MKRKNLLNAALYGATGVLWICNSMDNASGFYLFLGLIWLLGAVIWIVRYYKERKDSKKEN